MTRARISTTVDAERLAVARRLISASDSRLFDRALAALIDQLEAEHEAAALIAHPYDEDPNLSWETDPGPVLPYEGKVPAAVLRLAEKRRQRR